MLEKALSFGGWTGFFVLSLGNTAGILYWIYLIKQGKQKQALFWLIIIFPFTFYTARAFGISAYYDKGANFDQRIGLTTGLIFALFFILGLKSKINRPRTLIGQRVEYLLWGFATSVTISQLMSHDIISAFLLSIGAAWQYLLLFYLLISLITKEEDILSLLNSIFIFSLVNIAVRVFAKGENFLINPSSQIAGNYESGGTYGWETGRVGSGALGPAVSYAGYLVMFFTLGLGTFWVTKGKRYLFYLVIIFIELLNTYTRGGIFVISLLGLLIFYADGRNFIKKNFFKLIIILILSIPIVFKFMNVRGFDVDPYKINNFTIRLNLIKYFFSSYSFSFWGKGIFNDTLFYISPTLYLPVHNAYFNILDTCGTVSFFFFVVITFYVLMLMLKTYRSKTIKLQNSTLSKKFLPFLIIAFAQWIVFSNTTSTSVLAYYPYEGTVVFWITCYLGVIFFEIVKIQNLRFS